MLASESEFTSPLASPSASTDGSSSASSDFFDLKKRLMTPDFLRETPEHDRLWFEQKPPRDFDF